MTAINQNVAIRQGDSRNLSYSIKSPDGRPPTFVSPACSFVVTANYASGPDKLSKTGLTPVNNAGAWSVEVSLSAVDTASIPIGKYFHQLRLNDTDGTELTLAVGFFEVLAIRPTP